MSNTLTLNSVTIVVSLIGATIAYTSSAQAAEPTVLYDANGNAVVAYLTCENKSTPSVLFTQEKKPVAAYVACAQVAAAATTATAAQVKPEPKKGVFQSILTGTKSTARRTARRVTERKNDD